MLAKRLMKHAGRPITKRVAGHIKQRVAEEVTRRTSLTPIGQFDLADVFIVGYPRSGNTWFQNLVSGIVYGVDPGYAPDTLIAQLVPDVHSLRYYHRFQTPLFFKSHHLPRPEYRRIVYLIRDGRDVMVSYYHYLEALRREAPSWSKLLDGGYHNFGTWPQHIEGWLSNPYDADMLVIKYEDLHNDTVGELRRFCEFIGIDIDRHFLQTVANQSSFEKMRHKEANFGRLNPNWPRDKFFVRRGEVGSHRDEMPVPILDAFTSMASEVLSNVGYR